MSPTKFVVSLALSGDDVKRIFENITDRETEKDIYNRVRNAVVKQVFVDIVRNLDGERRDVR